MVYSRKKHGSHQTEQRRVWSIKWTKIQGHIGYHDAPEWNPFLCLEGSRSKKLPIPSTGALWHKWWDFLCSENIGCWDPHSLMIFFSFCAGGGGFATFLCEIVLSWWKSWSSVSSCFVPTNNSSEPHKRFHPPLSWVQDTVVGQNYFYSDLKSVAESLNCSYNIHIFLKRVRHVHDLKLSHLVFSLFKVDPHSVSQWHFVCGAALGNWM